MTQGDFGFVRPAGIEEDAETLIAAFKVAPRPDATSRTISAEASQVRSLVRQAREAGLSLGDLMQEPGAAARLIELGGHSLNHSTVLLRARAIQNFAVFHLGEGFGRRWIDGFREALPRRESRGWWDEGVSLPGSRKARVTSPTPDSQALQEMVGIASLRSKFDGAIAALACFSGLELDEIVELKWRDFDWHDGESLIFASTVTVQRREHKVTCSIAGEGARPLMALAMASGFERDTYVFPGRQGESHISTVALAQRLRSVCAAAGWPGTTRSQLIATYALWLHEHGVDEHSIKHVLGRRQAASVDRLLKNARSISSQRFVDAAWGNGLDR